MKLNDILNADMDHLVYWSSGVSAMIASVLFAFYASDCFYLVETEMTIRHKITSVLALAACIWFLICSVGMFMWLRDNNFVRVPKT